MPDTKYVEFAVTGTGSGVAQHVDAGGHTFESDTYPAFGGKDAHPSPLVYLLAGLSSCNQVTASIVAKELGVTLGEWSISVVGELDPSVLVGGAEGNANFDRVTVRATVHTDADASTFDRLVSETSRRCPVTQMFVRSGLTFDNEWTNAPIAAVA